MVIHHRSVAGVYVIYLGAVCMLTTYILSPAMIQHSLGSISHGLASADLVYIHVCGRPRASKQCKRACEHEAPAAAWADIERLLGR